MRRLLSIALIAPVALVACGEQQVFHGPPAQSADECRAQYDEARQRSRSTYVHSTTSAEAAGVAIGRGLAKGMMESAYKQCLARVAQAGGNVTPVAANSGRDYRAPIEAEMTPRRAYGSPHCPKDAGVLYGGVQYCR
jgi:hypothetical protein